MNDLEKSNISTEIKTNDESNSNQQQIDLNDNQNADNYEDINDNELNQTSMVISFKSFLKY